MKEWDLVRPFAEFAYYNYKDCSTQMSPFKVVGQDPNSALDLASISNLKKKCTKAEQMVKSMKEIHEEVREHIETNNMKYKQMFTVSRLFLGV